MLTGTSESIHNPIHVSPLNRRSPFGPLDKRLEYEVEVEVEDEAPSPTPTPITTPIKTSSKLDPSQIKAGQKLYDNLQNAPKDASVDYGYAAKIKNPEFEKGKNGECPKIKEKSPSAESKEIHGPMHDLGLDADAKFQRAELSPPIYEGVGSETDYESSNAISAVLTSKDQSTLIVAHNWTERYYPGVSESDKIPESEFWFQQWKVQAPNAISTLKYNVRQNIVETETQKVILDTNKNKNGEAKLKSQVTFSSTAAPKADGTNPEKDGFMALAQTHYGKTIFKMLTDHKKEFKGLNVVKVHTWCQIDLSSVQASASGLLPHMIWELGH